jgi:hypothetical protein
MRRAKRVYERAIPRADLGKNSGSCSNERAMMWTKNNLSQRMELKDVLMTKHHAFYVG